MSVSPAPKRRVRRIAADEAHSWARNLRLGNHHAKSVLRSLTLYVDGDGFCFVGIEQLADDCELSSDTVRRRLAWLEEIGAITRRAQWIDASGVRNGEGRGKRTTDLIRLLIEADEYAIQARARGDTIADDEAETATFSPSSQQGLNQVPETVSPRPALGQPSHCGQGLISEPEPESPLKSPQGDESARSPDRDEEEEEPEGFAEAWSSWPGHEAMRRDLAVAEFGKLSADKQRQARAAIPLFFQMQAKLGRKHPPNFHTWLRHRGFEEFPGAAAEAAAPTSGPRTYDSTSREGRALKALYAFARVPLWEHQGRVTYPLPITSQVLAFAELPRPAEWRWIEDRAQLAAWSTFLGAHLHRPRPSLLTTRGIGDDKRSGFEAPWPWPPRKDGSISADEETQQQGAE